MQLKQAEWYEPWMTDEEKRIMKKQMAAMRRLFKNANLPESPLISMRAIDIGIQHLLARRLEKALAPTETKMATPNATAPPVPTFALAPLVEQIGKTRERLRKAMRELEDVCARLGAPVEIGLADQMLPIVCKTRDLLNDIPFKNNQITIDCGSQ
ncbi:MAG TPA: hypothetical protein ENN29_06530 [Candidatus Hydrogenedentes bacterium]|nr:hypothetical protein [Candidatus Hydrogenedentota bacterium]